MKRYIKNNKIYDLPIVIQKDGKTICTNNQTLILENGYEIYTPPAKSIEQLIQESVQRINKETDEKILNNFVWKENEFYLTMENQTNFANMYISRDYLAYPITIKTKTGFMNLNNKQQVTEFYLAGVGFIQKCLEQGWKKKAQEQEEIRR